MAQFMLDESWQPNGLPGVTPAELLAYCEAASICLERVGHPQILSLIVEGESDRRLQIERLEITPQRRRAHADLQEATEFGACAIAFLVVLETTSWTVIERAVKGTGFDYWLGDESEELFDRKARLEVSGILKGTRPDIINRIRRKVRQVARRRALLPAVIMIVEFGQAIAHVSRYDDDQKATS